jgi:hypothetical protein|tara:strand:+ start:2529 stop:2849 length:321 start_codon:yes stop_codon:yes gene_type:complete
MLKQSGQLYTSDSIKKSAPIQIPVKLIDTVHIKYDSFDNSIPNYGSYEPPQPIKHRLSKNIFSKCSESSDFPNQPFGKSPPNKSYIAAVYLNIIAANNLKSNFIDT